MLEGGWRWSAIIGGTLAIAAGVAALVWPEPTLVVISIFVAWYLLIRGIFDVVMAVGTHARARVVDAVHRRDHRHPPRAWAIGNPDRSVLLFVSIIGIWAIFKGAADLVASFSYRRLKKDLAT